MLEQIRVAAGGELPLTQKDVEFRGHAIECRINAENPVDLPALARQDHVATTRPAGSACASIPRSIRATRSRRIYDSLVGKLIVHGKTRTECLMRLKRALDEFVVDGIETTLPLFRKLVRTQDIIDGNYHIHWLEQIPRRRRDGAVGIAGRQCAAAAISLSIAHSLSGLYGFGTKIAPDTASSCSIRL